jgi:hypothetical protein
VYFNLATSTSTTEGITSTCCSKCMLAVVINDVVWDWVVGPRGEGPAFLGGVAL